MDHRSQVHDRSLNYHISGPAQTRPPNFLEALRNDAFKDSLISFLVESWSDDCLANVIDNKIIYVPHREKCYLFRSSNDGVYREEIGALCSSHDEAETRMFFHFHSIRDNSNVVIRSNDADVLVIAIGQEPILKSNIWIEVGFYSNNSLEYIHVNHIVSVLGVTRITCLHWM